MVDMIYKDINIQTRQRLSPVIEVVDSHTCGQPTRVIVAGAGLQAGCDPSHARELLAQRDWIRRLAVLEPRGHRSMFCAVLIEPAASERDYGVAFMDAHGYPDMCGHALIGVATTLVELGLVSAGAPDGAFDFALKTPVGALQLRANLKDGRCASIAFRSPLAYYLGAVDVPLPGGGLERVDVAYGGQWYAFLPAEAVGARVEPDQIDRLIALARPVRDSLRERLDLIDPVGGLVPRVGNIVWTSAPTGEADGRNVPISIADSFDRSPCGTATCARLATLVAKGGLSIGQPFINQGILGTTYRAVAVRPVAVAGVAGIVPEVQGSAWITAKAQLWLDETDPLGGGFLIGNGEADLGGLDFGGHRAGP
jgi:proline racemase